MTLKYNFARLVHAHGEHVNDIIGKNNFGSTIDGVGNESLTKLNHGNALVLRKEAILNNSAILAITEFSSETSAPSRNSVGKSNLGTKGVNLGTAIGKLNVTSNFYSFVLEF